MEVNVENWPIKKLLKLKDEINEQPEYQRGDVWKPAKKKLLIDSILRGIDIPKFYLRKLNGNAFKFEVADGQQRLNSIFLFNENKLKLESKVANGLDLSRIGTQKIGDKKFNDLKKSQQDFFLNYKLTVAIVENAKENEIRTLFGRLQLGTSLSPAEKRNAIISNIGNHIDNFALNHKFFTNSRIPKRRYKHQDYLAHVLALIKYKNKKDLKADLLHTLYLDKKVKLSPTEVQLIDKVLDYMYSIDKEVKSKIVNKFAFIDIFWFLYKDNKKWKEINVQGFAKEFNEFEKLRLMNKGEPEKLLSKRNSNKSDKLLYDYILAFDYEGSLKENIDKRNRVINYYFKKYLIKK